MIERTHTSDGCQSVAQYSPCEKYRYAITRVWDADLPRLGFVMLNPSKATEQHNDPTVARCQRRAALLGFGGFRVTNIFAWRETDPVAMRRARAPVGPENDHALVALLDWADTVIAAWGVHGIHQGRGADVAQLLLGSGQPVHTLGLTKDGHPRHPLYVAYAQEPMIWLRHSP